MMTRSGTHVNEASIEPLLEELLAEVVTGIRPESKEHNGESITAALTEAAMVSFSRTVSHASAVERALLVDALSPALAEALAPALAKALAPEIVTALSHLAAAPEPAPGQARKTEVGKAGEEAPGPPEGSSSDEGVRSCEGSQPPGGVQPLEGSQSSERPQSPEGSPPDEKSKLREESNPCETLGEEPAKAVEESDPCGDADPGNSSSKGKRIGE